MKGRKSEIKADDAFCILYCIGAGFELGILLLRPIRPFLTLQITNYLNLHNAHEPIAFIYQNLFRALG